MGERGVQLARRASGGGTVYAAFGPTQHISTFQIFTKNRIYTEYILF